MDDICRCSDVDIGSSSASPCSVPPALPSSCPAITGHSHTYARTCQLSNCTCACCVHAVLCMLCCAGPAASPVVPVSFLSFPQVFSLFSIFSLFSLSLSLALALTACALCCRSRWCALIGAHFGRCCGQIGTAATTPSSSRTTARCSRPPCSRTTPRPSRSPPVLPPYIHAGYSPIHACLQQRLTSLWAFWNHLPRF